MIGAEPLCSVLRTELLSAAKSAAPMLGMCCAIEYLTRKYSDASSTSAKYVGVGISCFQSEQRGRRWDTPPRTRPSLISSRRPSTRCTTPAPPGRTAAISSPPPPDGTMLLASGYGNNPNTGSGLGFVKVSLADGRRWNLLAG